MRISPKFAWQNYGWKGFSRQLKKSFGILPIFLVWFVNSVDPSRPKCVDTLRPKSVDFLCKQYV